MSGWQDGKLMGMELIHGKETARSDIVRQMVNLGKIQSNLDKLIRRPDVAEVWTDQETGIAVIGFFDFTGFHPVELTDALVDEFGQSLLQATAEAIRRSDPATWLTLKQFAEDFFASKSLTRLTVTCDASNNIEGSREVAIDLHEQCRKGRRVTLQLMRETPLRIASRGVSAPRVSAFN